LQTKYEIPFLELAGLVFDALNPLLIDNTTPDEHRAALVRLKAYAGLGENRMSIAELATRRIKERIDIPGLLFPPKVRVNRYLERSKMIREGLQPAFAKARVAEYDEALRRLTQQPDGYDDSVRQVVPPRARESFRRPEELYLFDLAERGIEAPP